MEHTYHWGNKRECENKGKGLVGKLIVTTDKYNPCEPFICNGYKIKPLKQTTNGGFELVLTGDFK